MSAKEESVERAFLNSASRRLDSCAQKIRHCTAQLSHARMWWRPTPEQNSIGNLILHLCGNVGQWILSGVGGAPDVRDRPREFVQQPELSKSELLESLDRCVSSASAALSQLNDSDLLDVRRIQGFETNVLSAILDTVSHFQGHTQEIISLTRQQLGGSYEYHWVPTTDQERSPNDSSAP